jgi:hypothetical protein
VPANVRHPDAGVAVPLVVHVLGDEIDELLPLAIVEIARADAGVIEHDVVLVRAGQAFRPALVVANDRPGALFATERGQQARAEQDRDEVPLWLGHLLQRDALAGRLRSVDPQPPLAVVHSERDPLALACIQAVQQCQRSGADRGC